MKNYEINSGSIMIDNVWILNNIERRKYGISLAGSSDTWLFKGSILRYSYGNLDAEEEQECEATPRKWQI
jgi:hypothetical protein